MYKTRTICRACDHDKLVPVFDQGLHPLANDFVKPGETQKGYAPLKVMFCPNCTLAQLSVVVDPGILYANYPYVTSRSQMMLEHFQRLWEAMILERNPAHILEIGSNDGWFLKFCRGKGADSVIGIDPADNLLPPTEWGITTICGVFDEGAVEVAKTAMPVVDVIVARHVFAHIDDWKAFVANLDTLASRETLILIECPYVADLLSGGEFDTIYHEHLSYISIQCLTHLLKNTPFHLHKLIRFPIHGGAIVIMIRRNDCGIEPDPSVDKFLENEQVGLSHWIDFSYRSKDKVDTLQSMVRTRVSDGQSVCGFGASAKSTVWVNACGFTKYELAFIADSTPQKWGCFSPGSDIPIVEEAVLLRERPPFAVCFAWNYISEIVKKQSAYLEKGGKFIVPIPEMRVVGNQSWP